MQRFLLILFLIISTCLAAAGQVPQSPAPARTVEDKLAEEIPQKGAGKAALKLARQPAVSPPAAPILEQDPPFKVIYHPDGPLYVGDLVS
jgi:hypothetical protein